MIVTASSIPLLFGIAKAAALPNTTRISTYTAAQKMNIAVGIERLRTLNRGSYKRVIKEPAHPGKLQTGDGSWWELDEYEVHFEHLGAIGDGDTDDSQPVADAIATARAQRKAVRVNKDKTYLVSGAIGGGVYTSGEIYLVGNGAIKASAPGFKTLRINGADSVYIDGLKFIGGSSSPAVSASNEGLIEVKNVDGVDIRNITTANSAYVGVWLEACTDAKVRWCDLSGCASMIRLRGCNGFQIIGNTATSKSTPLAYFATGIQLESTNGHALGVNKNGLVSLNTIENYGDGQAFLAHAGVNIIAISNRSKATATGFGLNAASVAAETDVIENFKILDSHFDCDLTLAAADITQQPGIAIAGGSATNPAKNVEVTGNTVLYANRQLKSIGDTGGIDLKWTENCLVESNSVIDAYKNGIVDERSNINASFKDNVIKINGGASSRFGYLISGNSGLPSGLTRISGGVISNCDQGIRNSNIKNRLVIEDDITFVDVIQRFKSCCNRRKPEPQI